MLAIRMQRTGRKGYASFRMIVQDSRFSPTSGRVVAKVGHHNPHTKETVINKEQVESYLANGAQPTPRVVRLLTLEKIALPSWVEKLDGSKKSKIKNPEKLRKNQPKEAAAPAEEPKEEAADAEEAPAIDDKKEEPAAEKQEAAKEEPVAEVSKEAEDAPEAKADEKAAPEESAETDK